MRLPGEALCCLPPSKLPFVPVLVRTCDGQELYQNSDQQTMRLLLKVLQTKLRRSELAYENFVQRASEPVSMPEFLSPEVKLCCPEEGPNWSVFQLSGPQARLGCFCIISSQSLRVAISSALCIQLTEGERKREVLFSQE